MSVNSSKKSVIATYLVDLRWEIAVRITLTLRVEVMNYAMILCIILFRIFIMLQIKCTILMIILMIIVKIIQ